MIHLNTPVRPVSLRISLDQKIRRKFLWLASFVFMLFFYSTALNSQICCPVSQPQGAIIDLSLGSNGTTEINPTLFIPYVSSSNANCLPANGGQIFLWQDVSATTPFPNTIYNCAHVGTSVNVYVSLEVPGNPCATPPVAPFVVNIVDNVPPVATFPANVTMNADTGACSRFVNTLTPLVSDNCNSSFSIEWTRAGATPGSGTGSANGIYNVGTTTITWNVIYLVSAGNNDTITGTTTVLILDSQVPVIADCPSDIVQNNDVGTCSAMVDWTEPTASDNCGISSFTTNIVPPNSFPVGGPYTVTYTAVDVNGNISTCSFTVTVNDVEAPTFTNQITSLIVSPSPNCEQFVDLSGTAANDNCGLETTTFTNGLSFSITTNMGGPPPVTAANNGDPSGIYPVGDYDITFTAHDIHGNMTSYTINLVVEDQQDPVARCFFNPQVSLNSQGMYWLKGMEIDSASADNCGIVQWKIAFDADMDGLPDAPGFQDSIQFNCTHIPGPHPVLLEVIDANSNRDTCMSQITVEDNEPPVALCKDITVDLVTGMTPSVSVAISDIDDGSYDNCTNPLTDFGIRKDTAGSFGPGPLSFDCSEVGPNTVEIQVTDAEGNSNTCQATVTVRDVTPPVALAAPYTAMLGSNGTVTVTPANIDSMSTDDCGIVKYEISRTSSSSGFSQTGVTFNCNDLDGNPHNVWLRVMDEGDGTTGNSTVVMTTVTVQDNTNPTAVCQNFTANLDANGQVTVVPDDIDAGSFDNCSIVTHTVSPSMFDCSHIGIIQTVTLTLEDQSGNSDTCTSDVTVVDNIAPVAICTNVTVALGSNGQVNVGPATIGSLSTDNCCLFSYTLGVDTNRDNIVDLIHPAGDPHTFNCNDVDDPGGVFVSVTVEDCSGNIATCHSSITIIDTELPAITCPGNVTIECDASDHPDNTGFATATDNCGVDNINWTDSQSVPVCIGTYTITRTWTATDVNGNTSTCVQTIEVEDTTVPAFTAPADVTLDCPDGYVVANQVCTTYVSMDVPVPISPVGAPTITSVLTIPDAGTILDINVVDLGIEHTWVEDISVFLTSPGGTTIQLVDFSDNCSSEDNVEINFDDEATTGAYPAFPCPPNDQMSYVPKVPLASFFQEQILGNWTLTIIDGADEDGGNLISWGLEICYVTPPEDPSADPAVAAITGDVTDETDNCDPNPQAFFVDFHAYKDFSTHAEGGMYDFSNGVWTYTELPAAHDGSIDLTMTPPSISLTGANDGTGSAESNYGVTIPAGGMGPWWVAFDWSYVSNDIAPMNDPFGYKLNGVFFPLTDDFSTTVQSGRALIMVQPGDFFEFSQQSLDGKFGSATTTITNFVFIDGGSPLPVDGCPRKYCVARVWSLSDDCGNAAADQLQIIRTQDVTDPVIDFPSTITVLADNGICAPFIDLDLSQEISDACTAFGDLTITNDALAQYGNGNGSFDASGYYSTGLYNINFQVQDECGNSSSLSIQLEVVDVQAPSANCQPFITVQLDNNGEGSLTPVNVDNGSSDNCGITNMTLSQSMFTVDDIGQVPVTLTVEDAAGNSNSCTSVVTVLGGVIFDAADVSGTTGDMVLIPVSVENFTDITSFQFDMNITDGTVATIVGVQDIHPDLTGFLSTVNSSTSVTVSWFDATVPIGHTFSNGTVIFNLKVMLAGVVGSSTPVVLINESSSQLVNGGPGSAMVPTLGLSGTISILNPGISHNINGLLMREPMCGNDPIHLVDVTMTGSAVGNVNPANGSFSFSVPQNASVTITPSKNINWTNGVTVNDALLVHQHAGGFAALNSPYKVIAADANRDNQITVFDASLIHQLSIGFIPNFPGNTSWRFVPANPPLATAFPVPNEFLSYANVTADIPDADFIGVKVGDVNCTADPVTGFSAGVDERAEKLRFSIEDQQIAVGQDVFVTFASQNFTNVSGYQMTVNFDTDVLQLVEALPGNLTNMGGANFNPLRSDEGLLATNWYNLTPVDLPDGYELFTLHFKAMNDAATLSELISVSEDYIVIEAVKGDGQLMGIGLNFENPTATGESLTDRFALYQNRPNPFANKTVIGFHLPTGDDASLTLSDASGKTLKVIRGYYSAGYHQVIIDRSELPVQGVVFYRLQTSQHSAVRKMILMD